MADTEQTQTEETAATAAESTETTQTDDLGEKGKEAIRKEREARKAAEKERDELQRLVDEAAAAKAKAEEEDAKARGEFEKLANDRLEKLTTAQADLKTVTAERDAALARVQAYEDRDRTTITEGVKDLPEDLRDFDPGADAPLDARLAWFEKARAHAAKRTTDPQRGNGRNPSVATTEQTQERIRDDRLKSGIYPRF